MSRRLVSTREAASFIHHYGTPSKAVSLAGKAVERKASLYVPEWHLFVPCTPYDNHFIYENNVEGQPAYMCTCGSAAIIPREQVQMFACLYYKMNGVHQGDSKWL